MVDQTIIKVVGETNSKDQQGIGDCRNFYTWQVESQTYHSLGILTEIIWVENKRKYGHRQNHDYKVFDKQW